MTMYGNTERRRGAGEGEVGKVWRSRDGLVIGYNGQLGS